MALTKAWTKLKYHAVQHALWHDPDPFKVVVAGRGSGKTEISRRFIVRMLPVIKPWEDPIYAYCLPTLPQAKRVAWEPLKKLVPAEWIKDISESDKVIETVFGSKLFLLGLDAPQRAEGVQWDGVIIDESSDVKPGTVDLSFLPALSHRNPFLWRIGVPKRYGIGGREFKKVYDEGLLPGQEYKTYTWPSSDIIPPAALERARKVLTTEDFEEQYGAAWKAAGGAIYYAFSDEPGGNVDGNITYNPDLPLIVGSDFNVNPMAWTLSQPVKVDGVEELHTVDELFIRNTNTPKTLDHLDEWAKKNGQPVKYAFIGDASARARKTSASSTDYLIIANDERFTPKKVLYPKANPPVTDRFASCNAMLCNAAGQRRAKIHPRCKYLIQDLKDSTYKEGTREPDKTGDVSHSTDGWGYVICRLYPIRLEHGGQGKLYTGSV